MNGINLDDFCNDASRILVLLMQSFPLPRAVFVEDICGAEETDEFGMHSKRYLACHATLLWLGKEGYIRYTDIIRQDAVEQAELTGRCATILLSPRPALADLQAPHALQIEQSSLGYHLHQAVKARNSADTRMTLLQIMAEMHGTADGAELRIKSATQPAPDTTAGHDNP